MFFYLYFQVASNDARQRSAAAEELLACAGTSAPVSAHLPGGRATRPPVRRAHVRGEWCVRAGVPRTGHACRWRQSALVRAEGAAKVQRECRLRLCRIVAPFFLTSFCFHLHFFFHTDRAVRCGWTGQGRSEDTDGVWPSSVHSAVCRLLAGSYPPVSVYVIVMGNIKFWSTTIPASRLRISVRNRLRN